MSTAVALENSAHGKDPAESGSSPSAAALIAEAYSVNLADKTRPATPESPKEEAKAIARASGVLLGGIADGLTNGAANILNTDTLETVATSYGLSYGVAALAKAGPIGRAGAVAGGVYLGAKFLYGEYESGRPQATIGAVADAYQSDKHLAQDRRIVATTGGALAYDVALTSLAGGIGLKQGFALRENWHAPAIGMAKTGFNSVADFLAKDGREHGSFRGDGALGTAFAGHDGAIINSKIIDASALKRGSEIDVNENINLLRHSKGQLYVRGTAQSDGVYGQIEAKTNVVINPDEKVYFGPNQNDALVMAIGRGLQPGTETGLTKGRIVGKEPVTYKIYIRETGDQPLGTFVQKSPPGVFSEVPPNATSIHMGPHGIFELVQTAPAVKTVNTPGGIFDHILKRLQPTADGTFPKTPAIRRGEIPGGVFDATNVPPGHSLNINDFVSLWHKSDGQILVRARSSSDGLFTRVEPNKNIQVRPDQPIYFGGTRYDKQILEAAQKMQPGSIENYSVHRTLSKDAQGNVFIKDDGQSSKGTFIKTIARGDSLALTPANTTIHMGEHGQFEVKLPPSPVVKPAIAPVVAKPAAPQNVGPNLGFGGPYLQTLDNLYRARSGARLHDKDWRVGQYGDVVLDTALAGRRVGNDWIQALYGKEDEARSSARFIANIFRRRLAVDPQDTSTAPPTSPNVEKLTLKGETYFAPTVRIDGIGKGHVILDGDLQPAGLIEQNGNIVLVHNRS